MKEPITYECRQCGNRFVVSETGEGRLSPLYCCGEAAKKSAKKITAAQRTRKTKKPSRRA